MGLVATGSPGLEMESSTLVPVHLPGIQPMPTFSLVSELTLATVSSHFPNPPSAPSSPAASASAVDVERLQRHSSGQSSAMATLSTNLSWEAQGVVRQSATGADERVTEVLEITGLAGSRRSHLSRTVGNGGKLVPKTALGIP